MKPPDSSRDSAADAIRTAIERALASPEIALRLEVSGRLPSTQDRAKALAEAGAPEWTAVLAMEQTAGRGRRERRWRSDAGQGLYLSLVLRPGWLSRDAGWFSLIGALAAATVLDNLGVPGVRIKAPNDVLAGGRKIAGLLVEPRLGANAIDFVVLGIGMNLSQRPGDFRAAGLEAIATSCSMEGVAFEIPAATVAVIRAIAALYRQARDGGRDDLMRAWMLRGGGSSVPGWA